MFNKTNGIALAALLGAVSLGVAGCAPTSAPVAEPTETTAAAPAAWSYEGADGPDAWGTLDPTYVTCVDGTAQSPIDITATSATDLENIQFNYVAGEAGVFNNGHTVEAEPMTEGEDTIAIDGTTYPFLQFHFHAPSEHAVNGEHYPLEVHFVHKTDDGKIAVVGVFIKEGKTNAAWQPFVDLISSATEDPEANLTELDWAAMLPKVQTTYRYDGSLTTPGCAEGVKWNVMTTPISMSADQIAAFVGAYANNARPTQPLNDREVLEDSSK